MAEKKLYEILEPGDIVFVYGKGIISGLIGIFSLGKASHVGLVYSKEYIYETDGRWFKSKLNPLSKYDEKPIRVFRMHDLDDAGKQKIQEVCRQRLGTPYSYLDCFNQAWTFFLNTKIKGKIASFLGNSRFTKCDEETKLVLFRATGRDVFKLTEIGNPQDFLEQLENHKDFAEVLKAV